MKQSDPGKKQFCFLYAISGISASMVVVYFIYSLFFVTPSFTALTGKNTEEEAIRLGTYLAKDLFTEGRALAVSTLPETFPERAHEIIKAFNLLNVKLFSPSGETIFSADKTEIGVINTKEYFRNVVAQGRPYTKMVQKNSESLEGQTLSLDVVETYVPCMDGGQFLGAFEIYFNITETKKRLDELISHTNMLLYLISGFLFAVIALLSIKAKQTIQARYKAEQTITKQRNELNAKNQELHILNEIGATISTSIELEFLLPTILGAIMSRLKTYCSLSRCGIFLRNKEGKLFLAAHQGDEYAPCHNERDMSHFKCLCNDAVESGTVIFSVDSTCNLKSATCCTSKIPHGHVVIPLQSLNQIVGVLCLRTELGVHLENKKELFQSIGSQVGLAIDNATHHKEVERLSLHDPLTGLPNRRMMDQTLIKVFNAAERYQRTFAVCMVDIDFFKKYNDEMGHDAGDRVLAHVAELIRKEMRSPDFAARYGGEEFLLILDSIQSKEAVAFAERIRSTVEEKSEVTLSVGVTAYKKGDSIVSITQRADKLLYKAKENGRNRVEYEL